MVAAYFKWKSNAGKSSGPASAFWEAVDSKVIAYCHFAQTELGYVGDDASFEADGEVLTAVRQPGSKPWTAAALLIRPQL